MDPSSALRGILLGDTAQVLGRLGRELEAALGRLCAASDTDRVEIEYECAEIVWRYFVQREALVLSSHAQAIETFGIPGTVLAKVGCTASEPLRPPFARRHPDPERHVADRTERTAHTSYGPMAYLEAGHGPAMVFLHGWPFQKQTFQPLIRQLRHDFRCLAFDLIDIGASRPATRPPPLRFREQARAVREAIATLGVQRYVLVGQNSGGFIARLVAEDNPEVTNLVLIDTEIPGLVPPWIPLYQRMATMPLAAHVFRLAIGMRLLARSPMVFGGCFHDRRRIDDEFLALTAQPLLDDPERLAGCLRFLGAMDWDECRGLTQVHARIPARVDLIWGEQDPFFPIDAARRILGDFPNPGEFVGIAGARLLPYAEHPALVAACIRRVVGGGPPS